jgi:hypothetical protein
MKMDDPRDWPQHVVAIDPGAPHHGVVMAKVTPEGCLLTGAWELSGEDELYDRFSLWARSGGLANLVLEEYRLYLSLDGAAAGVLGLPGAASDRRAALYRQAAQHPGDDAEGGR